MNTGPTPPRSRQSRTPAVVLVAVLFAGAAVSLTLGLLGAALGEPRSLPTWGFSSVQTFKAWLAGAVLVQVLAQLVTALSIYQKLPGRRPAPRWAHLLHRITGTAAFLAGLPVAFYCLYGFGFDATTPRTLMHSLAGCLFYGAFTTKMLALRGKRLPRLVLPLAGGATFTLFVLAWTLGAAWWFRQTGLTT